jgi:hypothetical protein
MSLSIAGQFLLGGGKNSLHARQNQILKDPNTDLLRPTSLMLPLESSDGSGNLGLQLAFSL